MVRFLSIAILVLFSCTLHAQEAFLVSPAASNKLRKLKEAHQQLDLEKAKHLSAKLVKDFPEWPEAWKAFAEVCQDAGDIDSSEKALRKMVMLDSSSYPEAYRWIAEWTFKRGDYPDARLNLSRYLSLSGDSAGYTYRLRLLNESISFSLEQTRRKDPLKPQKLIGPVNTNDHEYFPSLSVDGSTMVFTRQSREPATNEKKLTGEDLYYTDIKDGNYLQPSAFPFPINSPGNEGTQSLRQDGRIMFFTACSRPDTKGGCDIYYCLKSGDEWSDPENLGYPVNSRYWESTPFLAPDGNRLFFASNRPGGFGGMDIWMATLNPDRSWSAPINMGPFINTALDEMSPVLLVDGKSLFFASNGHVGLGGFDLFTSDFSKTGKTSSPINLGYGVNTCYNEDAMTINASGNLGLFASNRDSLTGKDIYQFDLSFLIPANTTFTLSGTVRDRITRHPIGARVEAEPHGETLISSVDADPVTGEYLLGIPARQAYRIGATSPGYLPYSQYYVRDSMLANGSLRMTVELEPINSGASIILENIFFALNSYELLPESGKDLNEILNIFAQNPDMVVEISGFTDSTGTDEYNLVLSQKRAESVRDYLINNGISPLQVYAKGYGRLNPIAENNSEEGRSKNRRTEMKVIRMK